MKPVDGVILDFDGTLAPGVVEGAVLTLHQFVNRWKPVPWTFVLQFVRTATAFRPGPAIGLLLDSLGLGKHREEALACLAEAIARDPKIGRLDPGARDFILHRKPGRVKVFSTAGTSDPRFAVLAPILRPSDFLAAPGKAKSDTDAWLTIAEQLRAQPDRWVVVDDSPLALWAAKTVGFTTVMRLNTVFGEQDSVDFSPWIDHRVRSFDELDRRFWSRAR